MVIACGAPYLALAGYRSRLFSICSLPLSVRGIAPLGHKYNGRRKKIQKRSETAALICLTRFWKSSSGVDSTTAMTCSLSPSYWGEKTESGGGQSGTFCMINACRSLGKDIVSVDDQHFPDTTGDVEMTFVQKSKVTGFIKVAIIASSSLTRKLAFSFRLPQ